MEINIKIMKEETNIQVDIQERNQGVERIQNIMIGLLIFLLVLARDLVQVQGQGLLIQVIKKEAGNIMM
jgi:hypothetical protein